MSGNLATGKLYHVTVNMFVHVENKLVLNQFSCRLFSSPESLVLKKVVLRHYRHLINSLGEDDRQRRQGKVLKCRINSKFVSSSRLLEGSQLTMKVLYGFL